MCQKIVARFCNSDAWLQTAATNDLAGQERSPRYDPGESGTLAARRAPDDSGGEIHGAVRTERGMHRYFACVRSASRGESKRQDDSLVVPGSW